MTPLIPFTLTALVYEIVSDMCAQKRVRQIWTSIQCDQSIPDGYNDELGIGIGVHQGSIPSTLLFVIVQKDCTTQISLYVHCIQNTLYNHTVDPRVV